MLRINPLIKTKFDCKDSNPTYKFPLDILTGTRTIVKKTFFKRQIKTKKRAGEARVLTAFYKSFPVHPQAS